MQRIYIGVSVCIHISVILSKNDIQCRTIRKKEVGQTISTTVTIKTVYSISLDWSCRRSLPEVSAQQHPLQSRRFPGWPFLRYLRLVLNRRK